MPYVVGLTGGIGSGKSAVADAFASLGVEIVDADRSRIGCPRRGSRATPRSATRFPDVGLLPDGEIDRARLRSRVFADASARARLEAALHPLIAAAARREIDEPGAAPTASPSCRCCSSAAARFGGRPHPRRRLPGGSADLARRRAQRHDAGRGARDHGDAIEPRGAPGCRRRRHRQRRAAGSDRAAGRHARSALPRAGGGRLRRARSHA